MHQLGTNGEHGLAMFEEYNGRERGEKERGGW
jgi:hypothetical protein